MPGPKAGSVSSTNTNLLHLLPNYTASTLPKPLVELATSLYGTSKARAPVLKKDEEIAREYACAVLAVERCVGVFFCVFLFLPKASIEYTIYSDENRILSSCPKTLKVQRDVSCLVRRIISINIEPWHTEENSHTLHILYKLTLCL